MPDWEEAYREAESIQLDGAPLFIITQRAFFDMLWMAGYALEEMSEIAQELERDGQIILGDRHVFIDSDGAVWAAKIKEN